MKNGHIEAGLEVDSKALAEINKFTRREFTADEIYSFSVILCDNEVDRDFERFTEDSLQKLCSLFVGKTGIADHSGKSSDQCARIYSCEVITDSAKKTAYGEDYIYLKAKAYMPKTEKNRDLITEIDAGIKKEVSIGCSVGEKLCSVCGSRAGLCSHKKGKSYKKNGVQKLCTFELSEPTDAYEWSFVAVPAQRGAGVTKTVELPFEEIIKSIKSGKSEIPSDYSEAIAKYIEQLEKKTKTAEEYLEYEKTRISGLVCKDLPKAQASVINAALGRMTAEELFKIYKASLLESEEPVATLSNGKKQKQKSDNKNKEFII